MTVQEALRATQDRDAGGLNRSAVRYAETLLQPGESAAAAVVANIVTRKERFPGVVVLTDRRVLAVCGLPGIKRSVSIPVDELKKCDETSSFLNYKAVFCGGDADISLTVDPETGERFSRCVAVMNGEEAEFDAVEDAGTGGLLNPLLKRNQLRRRRAREREAREAQKADAPLPAEQEAAEHEEDTRETARRLNRALAQARAAGEVADTDPRAVAARLAAELAREDGREDS